MRKKMNRSGLTILFLAFLGIMILGSLLFPGKNYSVNEKRWLAEYPEFNLQDLADGSWGDSLETWLADHTFGRDLFVGLNAYCESLLGQKSVGDIWQADGRLIEAPAEAGSSNAEKNIRAVNRFAASAGKEIHLALVPSAGWAMGLPQYHDREIIGDIYAKADAAVRTIDLTGIFSGNPGLYYRTDHHWTSEGAWNAYSALAGCLGREAAPRESFTIESVPDRFLGSTYSRSALWLTKPEEMELWAGSEGITVINEESAEAHEGVFYRERLEEADMYTVFLDGNHSLVRISNPAKSGRLLVIRDSYTNCLGCFLAESWGEVVLVDLRYYKSPVSALLQEEDFDDILVCYSLNNFITDSNIILLR